MNGTDQFFSCCPKFARRFLGPVNRLGNANPSLTAVQGVQGVKVPFSFMRVTFSGDMVHCFKSVIQILTCVEGFGYFQPEVQLF